MYSYNFTIVTTVGAKRKVVDWASKILEGLGCEQPNGVESVSLCSVVDEDSARYVPNMSATVTALVYFKTREEAEEWGKLTLPSLQAKAGEEFGPDTFVVGSVVEHFEI